MRSESYKITCQLIVSNFQLSTGHSAAPSLLTKSIGTFGAKPKKMKVRVSSLLLVACVCIVSLLGAYIFWPSSPQSVPTVRRRSEADDFSYSNRPVRQGPRQYELLMQGKSDAATHATMPEKDATAVDLPFATVSPIRALQPTSESDEDDESVSSTSAPTAAVETFGGATVPNPAGQLPLYSSAAPFSIVVVNFQEPFLVPTINTLLSTESADLISEILIIDDFSQPPVQHSWFEVDPRIHIFRLPKRGGLIKARQTGGNIARGDFMVLIDAHCKVYPDWLIPIRDLLKQDHKRVINMEVGELNSTTWTHIEDSAIGSKATFDWSLNHYWEDEMSVEKINELTEKRDSNPDPNQSPITMGMFATTKRWWHTIGGMDAELSTWGGENIEISLRTWLCGGEIRVARGSRIDHIYRSAFPYVVDTKLYHRNLARIVHAWMDTDDADRFYNKSHISRAIELGSFEEQAGVKRRLKCRPFAWYKNKFFNRAPLVSAPPGYDD